MKIISTFKRYLTLLSALFLTSCGDLPEYTFDQSEDYCSMSFPFAGGIIGRQYIGFLRIISTLQYLDADPTYKIIVTGPSHIELDAGSFQQLIIGDQVFKPTFEASHVEGELQLWGPTFIFDEKASTNIYQLIQQGYDLNILGRIEVGHQYETTIYNYFFSSNEKPFRRCINRLLDEDELKKLKLN